MLISTETKATSLDIPLLKREVRSMTFIMSMPRRVEHQRENVRSKFLDVHDLSERVFYLVKLDCECCEYKVVPDSRIWIAERSKVLSLTGEILGLRG